MITLLSFPLSTSMTCLENVSSVGAKEPSVLDDEQLLLLGGPKHSPGGGKGGISGGISDTRGSKGVDGKDDLGAFSKVTLRGEASVLVRDEVKEVVTGQGRGGRLSSKGSCCTGQLMKPRCSRGASCWASNCSRWSKGCALEQLHLSLTRIMCKTLSSILILLSMYFLGT